MKYHPDKVREVTRAVLVECANRYGDRLRALAEELDISDQELGCLLSGARAPRLDVLLAALELVGGDLKLEVELPTKKGRLSRQAGFHHIEGRGDVFLYSRDTTVVRTELNLDDGGIGL